MNEAKKNGKSICLHCLFQLHFYCQQHFSISGPKILELGLRENLGKHVCMYVKLFQEIAIFDHVYHSTKCLEVCNYGYMVKIL